MRTKQQWQTYRELELLEFNQVLSDAVRSSLSWFWQQINSYSRQEPQISEIINADGKTAWTIYDPVDEVWLQLDSQQDVLRWLEDRHRRSTDLDWSYGWNLK